MVLLIVLGALVGAAIVGAFAYLIIGWVGLAFVIIATVGLGALGWYGYVLYGKASDLAYEGAVVAKRVEQVIELVGELKVPELGSATSDDTPEEIADKKPNNEVQVSS